MCHEKFVKAKVLYAQVGVIPRHHVQLEAWEMPRQLPCIDAVDDLQGWGVRAPVQGGTVIW